MRKEVVEILSKRRASIGELISELSSPSSIDYHLSADDFISTMKGHIRFLKRISEKFSLKDLNEILEEVPQLSTEQYWVDYAHELAAEISAMEEIQKIQPESWSPNFSWKLDIHKRINTIRSIILQQEHLSKGLKDKILNKLSEFEALLDRERTTWEAFLYKARDCFSLLKEGGEAAKPACDRFSEITHALIDVHQEFSGTGLIPYYPTKQLPPPDDVEILGDDIPF